MRGSMLSVINHWDAGNENTSVRLHFDGGNQSCSTVRQLPWAVEPIWFPKAPSSTEQSSTMSPAGFQSSRGAHTTLKLLGFKNGHTMPFLHLVQRVNTQLLCARFPMVAASSPCFGSSSPPEMADSRAVPSHKVLTATHCCKTFP